MLNLKYALMLSIFLCYDKIFCMAGNCKTGYRDREKFLIVISFDGMTEEHFKDESVSPTLFRIYNHGVKANFTVPKYANVFSVHHSIATGNYPNTTGVFGPEFWNGTAGYSNDCTKDKKTYKRKLITYEHRLYENYKSYCHKVLPIWTLNELLGGTSACMMWPGCEYRYGPNQIQPAFVHRYDSSVPYNHRIEQIGKWMNASETDNPPNVVMIYFNQPDKYQHIFGPFTPLLREKIAELDNFTQGLLDKLELLKLKEKANIVFVSDHRMNLIRFKDILDIKKLGTCTDVNFAGSDVWLQYSFNSRENMTSTSSKLNGDYEWIDTGDPSCNKKPYPAKCYSQTYSKSMCIKRIKQIPPKIALMYPGSYNNTASPYNFLANHSILVGTLNYTYALFLNRKVVAHFAAFAIKLYPKIEKWKKQYNIKLDRCTPFGVHGYTYPEDTGFFMATGPAFVHKRTLDTFIVVDLYSLFISVLNYKHIVATERDGNYSRVKRAVKKYKPERQRPAMKWIQHIKLIIICAICHCTTFYLIVEIYLAKRQVSSISSKTSIVNIK